ncbi:MAG TPA: radical SAM/SPASM domain-containing protein [Elusimicrobia bacterium]|nr:radical SAM/SPASM domain-containing protein [Elusimicrobiota bacterium]HBT61617.1 radical SAM/SPASM domain-containing protein [Elusimicrobiota bacterium]
MVETENFVLQWLAWEITSRCNLSCIHCRSQAGADAGGGEFSTAQAAALIDDIASFSKPVLVLSGGEPLLRPDIFELAGHGASRGLRMALASNGALISDGICGRIKASGIRIVSLSLDGSTSAVHDDFRRQPGAFNATLAAAGALRRHGIDFIVNSSFTRRNQADIPEVYRLAKSLGARAWYLFMVLPTGRAEALREELIGPQDYEEILGWHYRMEKDESEMLVRPICAPHYYRLALQKSRAEGLSWKRRSLSFSTGGAKGCVCGQSIAFISAQGEVQPCSYFPTSAGNVKERAFSEIWRHSELLRSLRDFSRYKGRCGACEYIKVCGGCRARAELYGGDYLGEEPLCSHKPERKRGEA